jgi:hypothetical protein
METLMCQNLNRTIRHCSGLRVNLKDRRNLLKYGLRINNIINDWIY